MLSEDQVRVATARLEVRTGPSPLTGISRWLGVIEANERNRMQMLRDAAWSSDLADIMANGVKQRAEAASKRVA